MNWLMDNMEGIAFGFVAISVFGAFAWLFYSEKKRIDTIKAMAEPMGFTYNRRDETNVETIKNFSLFSDANDHAFNNVISGTRNGISVVMGEYDAVYGVRKNSRIHRTQTICLLADPDLSLPHFMLRREMKVSDAIGAMLGGQDINFADDKKFSAAFVLQGEKAEETSSFFTARVRSAFMKFANTETRVEGSGNRLLITRNIIIEPEKWSQLLKETFALYEILKKPEPDAKA
jgi:hypothetical protein